MRRTGLLVVVALATAAVLVPTAATPSETDTVGENLVMEPTTGPNGDYAVLDEDDEIALLLTGANPALGGEGVDDDAVTPIPRVFTITYTGADSAEVWITDDAESVRFYRGGDSADSIEGPDNSVVLGANDTVAVGLLVDTRGDHDVAAAETFTVHATGPGSEATGGSTGGEDMVDASDVDPTPTPTATDGRSTGGGAEPSNEREERIGGGGPTPTPTETPTGNGTPEPAGGGAVELGGLMLWPLLALVVVLALLGAALAWRRRSG